MAFSIKTKMMHIGFEIQIPNASFCSYEKRAMLTTKSVSCSGIPLHCLSPQFTGYGLRPQS